jgi:Protein of unknown function (DUF998)
MRSAEVSLIRTIMSVLDRHLLRCGLIAGPLIIGGVLLQGATREGYSQLRHPVSSLSLGPRGWMQTADFAVAGGLYLCFAVGLSRTLAGRLRTRVAPTLLGLGAIGMLGAAAFPTDPLGGYPLGTPSCPPKVHHPRRAT